MSSRFNLIVILGIMAVALCACGIGGPDTTTPENFAKAVVDSIKDNDYEKFESYCINKEVFISLTEQSTLSEEKKKKAIDGMEELWQNLPKMIRESYEEIREDAKKEGVEIGKIEYLNATYEIKMDQGVQTADIHVTVGYDNSKYKLKLDDCIKSKKGWIMGDEPRWRGIVK